MRVKGSQLTEEVRTLIIESLTLFNYSIDQFMAELVSPVIDYFILPDKGYICGIFIAGEYEILRFYIRPQYRNQGIGQQLLKKVQQANDIQRIILEVRASNANARHLYQKLGFHIIHCRPNYYHHPVEDALIMEWKEEADEPNINSSY